MLAQLQSEYPDDLRVIYRHFPLPSHDKAALATQASEAAGLQGKFWEMHDAIFETQDEWAGLPVDQFQGWLVEKAGALGLDAARFETDLTSEALVNLAKTATSQGEAVGLPGTPFLLFNGQPYQGGYDLSMLRNLVDAVLLEKRYYTECPPMTIDPEKQYQATIKTEKGDVVLELFAKGAPLAVNSFIFLANQDWYDGVSFHRVLAGQLAQGGDPSGTGLGGPGYEFDNEISGSLNFDAPGILGMANAGPGTNGSQFFITFQPTPQYNGSYTVFGRVVEGMDVLQKLTPRDPTQNPDQPPGDKILDIVIEEK